MEMKNKKVSRLVGKEVSKSLPLNVTLSLMMGEGVRRTGEGEKQESNEILRSAQNDGRPSCHPEQIPCHPELVSGSHEVSKSLPSYLPTLLPSKKDPSPKSKISTLPQGEGKRVAFTLAETLITLGIIGIVAAITLPTLIGKYQERAMVTRLQKFYSTVSQAYSMAVLENGSLDNWGLTKTVTVKDEENDSIYTQDTLDSFDKFWKIMDKYLQKAGYSEITDSKHRGEPISNGYGYTLADGNQVVGMYLDPPKCSTGNADISCGDFYVKVSNKKYGSDVKTLGQMTDVFVFRLNPEKITPVGLVDGQITDCLNGTNYAWCTGWVLTHGNMDYLHCDDLDFYTKTKCK